MESVWLKALSLLNHAYLRVALWLGRRAASRLPRPDRSEWSVTFTEPDQPGTVQVLVLFTPSTVPRNPYHVACVLDIGDANYLWMIDVGLAGMFIPIQRTDADPHQLIRDLQAKYAVFAAVQQLPLDESPMNAIGPVNCATLAKRLCGVDNPGIVTPEQLLCELWRMRDGWSST